MSKLSFLDKIKILFETTKSSNFIIIVLLVLAFLTYIFLTTNKKNELTAKKIFLLIYTFITIFIVVAFHDSLGKLIDYFMNNLFIVIYFPNLAVYVLALIVTNIILWISVFNYKTTKLIKNINIGVFFIINYILALILSVINNNNLDIFTQESIYGNKQAQGLIELSSTIFIVWILFLIIYKCYLIYLRKDYKPKVKKVYVEKKVRKLPDNIKQIQIPTMVKGTTPKPKEKTFYAQPQITPININQNYEEKQPISEIDKVLTAQIEETLTLDDYKLLLKILKNHRTQEKLIEEQKRLHEKEISVFNELQNLYK